jgi:hypothetical protein
MSRQLLAGFLLIGLASMPRHALAAATIQNAQGKRVVSRSFHTLVDGLKRAHVSLTPRAAATSMRFIAWGRAGNGVMAMTGEVNLEKGAGAPTGLRRLNHIRVVRNLDARQQDILASLVRRQD